MTTLLQHTTPFCQQTSHLLCVVTFNSIMQYSFSQRFSRFCILHQLRLPHHLARSLTPPPSTRVLLHLKQQPQSVHRPIVLPADHEAVQQQRTTRRGLGDGWSNTQHSLLRLLSTTPSGTANTSQCGNRGNAHGVAEDDSPQRTSPLHTSFEGSPSSPRAAPARRPSPASASAARWPPDRRLLGVRHTRSPAALT